MHQNTNSPTASMSSVTSGTPSTDIRFSDYPLDKVSSYIPSEDDDDRPPRAYSVGSRPETCRNKRHMELVGENFILDSMFTIIIQVFLTVV